MEVADSVVEIQVNKAGPSGRPVAIVTSAASVPLDKLTSAIQREVTRNTDLRTKLGLKGCPACAASGIDLSIRQRFEHVLSVDLGKIG